MKQLAKFLCIALFCAAFAACSDDEATSAPVPDPVPDKYEGGFYVLNEGQGNASINYYTPQGWERMIYRANNGDEKLGVTGTVAVSSDKNMYVVTKDAPFVVEIGLADFVKKSELGADAISGKANSFVLIDANKGVLTTTVGAYVVTLDPLSLAAAPFATGSFTDVAFTGGHIFMISSGEVKAYDAQTYELVKTLGEAKTGFAKADGALWAANGNKLLKINLSDLTSQEIALGEGLDVFHNQWAFSPTCLQASPSGEVLYFVNKITEGFTVCGRDVYKYTIASRTSEKLFTAPVEGENKFSVYGSGVNINPRTGDIYLVYSEDGWGEHFLNTNIYVVDGKTGVQKQKIAYTSDAESVYWFPSMVVFR